MIILACAIIGAVWGWYQAKRRGGNRKDMAQYAAGYGIAFTLVGMLITIILMRTIA